MAPRSWSIKRKGIKFILRSQSGPHPLYQSIPLGVLLRDILKIAQNRKEVKRAVHLKQILLL